MNKINIRDFKGVWTNADPEDLGTEWSQVQENFRAMNGKLVKTFGIPAKTGIFRSDYSLDALATYIHSKLPNGYIYIGPAINTDSNDMVLLYYDGAGWYALHDDFTVVGGIYYHNKAKNPIVQAGGIIRFLPGNAGEIGGIEAKKFWFGYIDRDYFDEAYSPAADFYGYPTNVDKPPVTIAVTEIDYTDSGFLATDQFFYKVSAIYDGVQESMLGDSTACWRVTAADKAARLSITGIDTNLSKRVTALKLYRKRYFGATGVMDVYKHIMTLDFLRKSTDYYQGVSGGKDSLANSVYVPNLASFVFDASLSYQLRLSSSGSYYPINNPVIGGVTEGYVFFVFSSFSPGARYNVDWSLTANTTGAPSVYTEKASGTGGAYTNLIEISEEITEDTVSGGILVITEGGVTESVGIGRNVNYTLILHSAFINSYTDAAWKVLPVSKGLYLPAFVNPNATIAAFDAALADGAEHPLYTEGEEKSVKVNGKFAIIISERLWQGNIVLDPGGENEVHEDWVGYSELGQFDVNPVSNVMYCEDREGGPVMGIAEIFGCPVVLKKQAIIFINIRADLNDPSKWTVKESVHNIGSLAEEGYVEAYGSLFVCWTDGIYRLRPNNLADSDATPTERLKITGPIEDIYQALTLAEIEAIKATCEPSRGEILFTLGDEVWAFNAETGFWREIVSYNAVDIFAYDENGQVLVYGDAQRDLFTLDPNTKESVVARWRKTFRIATVRKETVREIEITYKSASILTVNIYADGATTATWTGALPVP